MMDAIEVLVCLRKRRRALVGRLQEIEVRYTVNARSNSQGPSEGQGLQRKAADHVCLEPWK